MVSEVSKNTEGLADLVNAAKSGDTIGIPSFIGASVAADVEKKPLIHKEAKKPKGKGDEGDHWKL